MKALAAAVWARSLRSCYRGRWTEVNNEHCERVERLPPAVALVYPYGTAQVREFGNAAA